MGFLSFSLESKGTGNIINTLIKMVPVLSIHSLNSSPVLLVNYNRNSIGLQYRGFFYRKNTF